jgi:hypothetical protein
LLDFLRAGLQELTNARGTLQTQMHENEMVNAVRTIIKIASRANGAATNFKVLSTDFAMRLSLAYPAVAH